MDRLETLAQTRVPGASRALIAMQALAQALAHTDTDRLRPLRRALARDLTAALAGKAAPWSEARTRFEARKLARLASPAAQADAAEVSQPDTTSRGYAELLHVGAAFAALALWLVWLAQLTAQAEIAWDGGTGAAQTGNLVALYAPAVLALLVTLFAVNPPSEVRRT